MRVLCEAHNSPVVVLHTEFVSPTAMDENQYDELHIS